ncbi:MAG: ribonuclease R [Ruminococcaceae bacterium]|nr:ribonuclease R [Oscillospiraceae bacterium]
MEIRDKILEIIKDKDYRPKTIDAFYSELISEGADFVELFQAVNRLEEEGEIIITQRGKIMPFESSGYFIGTFRASQKDFGFVTPKDGDRADFFIPPDKTMGAIDGDTVLCSLIETEEGKSDVARITKIIAHSLETVIGTLKKLPTRGKKGRQLYTIVPDNKKYNFTVICTSNEGIIPKPGNKVEVRIVKFPKAGSAAKGEIIRDFGGAYTREANYEAVLHENSIKTEFNKETLREADIEAQDIPDCADEREDIRDRMIFTIDGADAKDLDDAVSVERTENGYILGVHIADVSHYVRQGSALDKEAIERGTSVYFVDQVVPMLPKALSNGICSLNPNEPRRALSAFISIDKSGNLLGCDLKKTLIESKVRGVYSEVNDLFEKGSKSEFFDKYSQLYPDTLPIMEELYRILAAKSHKRGALELETSEAKILVDENGIPCDIIKRERGDAQKLIEQFMLAANEGVANWLHDMSMPCVYRIHEDPDPDKIHRFAIFAHNLGLSTSAFSAKKLHPSMFTRLLEEAKEMGIGTTVSYLLLRSLSKAKYSESPSPHFGLCIDKYCHFTSPIRRYPDLATHRIISNILVGNISDSSASYLSSYAQKAAARSTENEQKAVSAERDIEDLYKCIYMQAYLGEEFDAVISSVTNFGIFCELGNTCEGLIPITKLDGYYIYNEETCSLRCGDKAYRLGDSVRVRVDEIDLIARKIEMSLAGSTGERYIPNRSVRIKTRPQSYSGRRSAANYRA